MKRLIIVDANNVLGAGVINARTGKVLDAHAATAVVEVAAQHTEKDNGANYILVFDAAVEARGRRKISVVAAPRGKKADDLIKSYIKNENPKTDLLVVSNDTELWNYARLHGFRACTPKDWTQQAKPKKETIRSEAGIEKSTEEKPLGTSKNDIKTYSAKFSRQLSDEDFDELEEFFARRK